MVCSACPFIWERELVLSFTWVPNSFLKVLKKWDVNWEPLSYIMDNGIPCRITIWLMCILASSCNKKVDLKGIKWSDFINLSTITHIDSTHYEVHVNVFPLGSRNINYLSQTTKILTLEHYLLTITVTSHKLRFVPFQTILPVDLFKIMIHFCGTRMGKISETMCFLKNTLSQILKIRHTQLTLIPNHPIPYLGEWLIKLTKKWFLQLNY